MRILLFSMLLLCAAALHAQVDTTANAPINMSQTILNNTGQRNLTLGLYGQIDYNQPLSSARRLNGMIDVHRLVTFLGYRFDKRTHFVSEIEVEHVKEIYVEQAFLNHAILPNLSLRAGLMLIPMGIINEYHEPTTFNGVERPEVDSKIIPTTWREMGAGIFGRVDEISLRYQLYAVNGFASYNDGGKLRGTDGFRKGRQKGAESIISSPNLASKVDFYGVRGLKLGLAFYTGRTQSSMYDEIEISNEDGISSADSTTVGMSMLGADFRYQNKAFTARGEFIYSSIRGSEAYNVKTDSDLGSAMMGYYGELAYDLLSFYKKDMGEKKLDAFVRFEQYDTHADVAGELTDNGSYDRQVITTGLTYTLVKGAALKADYQRFSNAAAGSEDESRINMGIGVWF